MNAVLSRGRGALAAVAATLVVVAGVLLPAGAATAPGQVTVTDVLSYYKTYALTSDASGNVYGVDKSTGAIFKLHAAPFSGVQLLATDPGEPIGITDRGSTLYVSNYNGGIDTLSTSGGALTTLVASASVPTGEAGGEQFAFDSSGNMFVANYSNGVLGEVVSGTSTEVTSGLRVPTNCGPWGILITKNTLYISCWDSSRVIKAKLPLTQGETPSFVATPPLGEPGDLVLDTHGNIYLVNTTRNSLVKIPTNGSKASVVPTAGTMLYSPWGLTMTKGVLYTSLWTGPNLIAKITLSAH